MCGIAGILDPTGVEGDQVRKMGDLLAHRGPDDASVHVEPGLGLAVRRLAIIDLEGGQQPITNEDGSVVVVFNGEIYNYREIRNRLRCSGHDFSTRTDTEVLVHLYEEMGREMVTELRGMFALAVWDRRKRSLLLARDHLGQKPLYWAREGRRLWFASEIKAILAVAPQFRRVDPEALHEYLTLRIIADPRSMYQGVHKLSPAHTLEVSADVGLRSRRYWHLAYEPKLELSELEAVEELERRMQETVELHLVSDVEVGAFLSGGIDSGLVTAFAAPAVEGRLRTFSMGAPYGEHDERPAARSVAERFRTRHHAWPLGADLLGRLPSLIHHADEPSDLLSVCLYELAQRAGQYVKVVLGGDGGDELFGGYDRYYGTRYAKYWALLPESVRENVVGRLLRMAPGEGWYKSLEHQVGWLNELASVEERRRYGRSLSYFYFTERFTDELYSDEFRRRIEGFDPEAAIAFWQDHGRARDALDKMLLADSMIRLPNHPVMALDRMTMAHGLEARSPFLDHRLAEFAATLPVRMKVRGRSRRWLETRVAERHLPQQVLDRPKQGFSSALPYYLAGELERIFRFLLADSRLVAAGWLLPRAIERLMDAHAAGRADHGNRLWLLLNAELWYRACIEQEDVEQLQSRLRSGDALSSQAEQIGTVETE